MLNRSIFRRLFAPEKLKALTECPTYKTAAPYPHLVIDDFFESEALDKVLEEWPDATRPDLEHHNDGTYVRKKTGSSLKTVHGPFTRRFLHRLGEPDFLQALGDGDLGPDSRRPDKGY